MLYLRMENILKMTIILIIIEKLNNYKLIYYKCLNIKFLYLILLNKYIAIFPLWN